MTPRVAIGAAGTTTAFGIVKTLKERWPEQAEVVAVDSNERRLVAAAALSDGFAQSPSAADPGYGEWLAGFLAAERIDYYVPLIDLDIVLAAELAADGALGDTVVAGPEQAAARICWDKRATHDWLDEAGIATPPTWLAGAVPAGTDPGELVAKSRYGHGSRGFRRLSGGAELEALERDETIVVQRRCAPPEVTIDALLARDGSFRAVCRERLEVKAGVCTKARVFESDELAAIAERVARGLPLPGACCIQVMRDGANRWSVTDVNARPGGGTRLSTAAGVDLLAAAYADLLGLPLAGEPLRPLGEDVYVVRQPSEYVVA